MDTIESGRGRKRSLVVLGGVTILFAALAVGAVWQRSGDMGPAFQPTKLFPELSAQIGTLAEVTIATKDASFRLRQVEGKGWVVSERNDFPADPATIRALGAALSELEAVEPRTARPELHGALGLGAPDKGGDAIRVSLSDAAKKPLADLLVSRTREAADADGRVGVYVRKSDDNQTWLARGSLSLQPEISAWLAKSAFTLARERIQSAAIAPLTGPAFVASRANAEQQEFQVVNLPAGRELSYPGAATNLATTISEFRFDDIRPVAQVDFAKASTVAVKTFDGLSLNVRLAAIDGAQWAILDAEGTGTERQQEADGINAKTRGWAFKIPDYLATALAPARDTLMKPIPAAPKP